MATPYPFIIWSLHDYSTRLLSVIPSEIICYIVDLYRTVPFKSDRMLEVSLPNIENLKKVIDILTSDIYEITFDRKNGMIISEKGSTSRIFHIKYVNTFYCMKDRIAFELKGAHLSLFLSRLKDTKSLLLYVDSNGKLLCISSFLNIQFSMDVKEIIGPNVPNFKYFEYVTVNKNHFDISINNIIKIGSPHIKLIIKDGKLDFYLGAEDRVKYSIKHICEYCKKFENCKKIDVCIKEDVLTLGFHFKSDVLYVMINPS